MRELVGEKVTDRFAPEWGVALERVADRSRALETDSLATARRIRQPITAKSDIEDAFDGITYGKGEAVLEMIEAWLGAEPFRKGVQAYLDRHAWGNATVSDFAASLSAAAGRDVATVLSPFLDQTGAPVLTAEPLCAGTPRLRLRQRPYRPLGSPAEARTWRVPACVRTAGRAAPACTLLEAAEGEIPLAGAACPDWSYANAGGAGYYRTLVPPAEARRALDANGLSPAERIALASEMRSLVASADLAAGDALTLVPRLAADPERRVVGATVRLVSDLDRIVDDRHVDAYREFVRSVFSPPAQQAGLAPRAGEPEDERLLRRSLVAAAGGLGHDPELRRQALDLARRWLDDPDAVDPDSLETVLALAAAAADRSFVDRLRTDVVKEPDRQRRERLLLALGSVRDPVLARVALEVPLDERVDARESVEIVWRLSQARETRRIAFDFLKANEEALRQRLPKGMMSAAPYFPMVAAGLCTRDDRREAEAFFTPRLAALSASPRILAQALERIDQCVARREAQQASLDAFLDGRVAASTAARP